MARTKDQSFVNRYLNQYQQNQKSAVSAGQQAASNAASGGVRQINATGNIEIPSLYDPTEDLYGFVLEQQKAQIKAQQAAAKAAQKAQEKAQKEAQERAKEAASESSATSTASNPLANRLSQNRTRSKVTEEEQPKKGILGTIGDWVSEGLSALSGGNKDAENKASTSGAAGVPARSLAKTAAVERPASAYDAMTVTEKLTAAQQLSEQVQALQSQIDALERQKVEPKTGAGAYDEEAYSIIQKNRQIVEQQDALEARRKQLNDQLSDVDDALWADPEYINAMQAEITSKSENERIAQYLDPSYKLNKLEEKDAKEIIKRYRKEAADTAWWFSGATDEQRKEALDKELIAADLETKVSDLYAFESNFAFSVPGVEAVTNAVVKAHKGDDYDPNEDSVQAFLAPTRAQSPIASTAGSVAGNLASYAAGSQLVGAIPGVGAGLQSAGQAIGGTRAAQLASKAPVIGKAFTPEAITGILGDQLVDTVLDTGAGAVSSVMQGDKSGAEIAADAAKNFGTNLAFNIGSAAVLGTAGDVLNRWKANRAVPSLEDDAVNQAVNMGAGYEPPPSLYDYADNAAKAVDNNSSFSLDGYIDGVPGAANDVPLPSLENAAQAAQGGADDVVNAWRSGTLTNAQLETLKPGGVNRAAFEQATGVKLPDTSSETRKFLRSIDNQQAQVYDEVNNMVQGGALNERTGENAVRGMAEDALPVGQGMGTADGGRGKASVGDSVLRQFLTPSENINEAIKRSGATPLELVDTTGNPQFFSFALEQARQTNPNGLMVSGKTVEELSQPGTVTFMSKDGLAGALVTADGDIEAVFKNPRSTARGAGSSLLMSSINNGGNKLDCYGDGLVNLYAKHGFEPVARVPWNPEYAPDGWTYGPKDVYVMKLAGGLDADGVAARLGLSESDGGFHRWTQEELNALPTMDYDQALSYRDSLIAAEKQAPSAASNQVIAASMDTASPSISAPVAEYAENTSRTASSATAGPEIPPGYKERGFAESIRTKTDLPDEVKQEFVDNPELYRAISNSETSARADEIYSQGLDRSMVEYNRMLSEKDPAAVPLGKKIADELISQGRRDEAVDVLRQMSQNLTQSGQFSQAAAIALLKNDPMTALQYIQKNIDRMNQEGLQKFGANKWKNFSLTPEEIDGFSKIEYGDEDALKSAFEQIGKRIQRDYPVTTMQKLVEASHIAMLLNPRTQIRNAAANLAFRPLNILSRKVSAVGQNIYKQFDKTYQPNQAFSISKKSKDLASEAYNMVRDSLAGNTADKWENTLMDSARNADVFKLRGDTNLVSRLPVLGNAFGALGESLGNFSRKVTGGQNVFENLSSAKSVAENIRQFTYGLLELGDQPFLRKEFIDRMGSYIEARGYKSLDEIPNEAFDAATQSALKATFKDDNRLTRLVSSVKRESGLVGEVVLPFTKTPANIAVRAYDYSPAGLAMGIRRWVKNGGDPNAYIDEISKGLTGTAAIVLGGLLYKAGVITGPASENADQAQYDKMQGKLPFAINVGGNYYTFDWMQPASSALVLGSTLASQVEKDGGLDGESVTDAIRTSLVAMGDTLLDMSPLQSVADIFGGYGTPTENVLGEFAEVPQRLIPSLSGAITRIVDPVQRQTFSNGDPIGTQIASAQSKIPVLSQSLPAAYDTWGREITRADNIGEGIFNQFVNPGEFGNANPTPMDDEISRLFEATGQTGVFPQKANWSETYGGETHKLTNEQYSDYQRTMGQISYDGAFSLLDSEIYGLLDDQQKAKAIQSVYAVGRDKALQDIFPDYSVPETRQKQVEVYDTLGAEGLADWLNYKAIADADGNDAISQDEALAALNVIPSLDNDERAYFWYLTNSKWKKNPYM